jgi:hypothetical protein
MGRKAPRFDIEEKIAREMLRLMPNVPKAFTWFFKKVEHFNYREPVTFITEARAKLEESALLRTEVSPKTARRLQRLMAKLPVKEQMGKCFDEAAKFLKKEAANDPRYSLLLKLMSEADKKVPGISMTIVSQRHGDLIQSLEAQCAAYSLLKQAERERGEARATSVLRALAETCEALYRPYLITIWFLSFFKEGEMPPQQVPSTGNLVKDSYKRLSAYPGLVEPNAAWMRNAATHFRRRYIPEKDAFEMWDNSVARRTVTVDELFEIARRMYQISGETIQRVARLHAVRTLFGPTGFRDEFVESFPLVLSGNAEGTKLLDDKFTAKTERMVRPVADFFNAHIKNVK